MATEPNVQRFDVTSPQPGEEQNLLSPEGRTQQLARFASRNGQILFDSQEQQARTGILDRYAEELKDTFQEYADFVRKWTPTKTQVIAEGRSLVQLTIHSIREVKKRRLGFILGVLSCTVVVAVVLAAVTALGKMPIVFLSLAETDQGQFDLAIGVSDGVPGLTLNYSMLSNFSLNQNVEDTSLREKFSYSSPRKDFWNVVIHSGNNCSLSLGDSFDDPSNWNWTYHGLPDDENVTQYCTLRGCVDAYCGTQTAFGRYIGAVMLIDTLREQRMGFGRDWPFPPLNEGECYLSAPVAEGLNVAEGDKIIVTMSAVNEFLGISRAAGLVNISNSWKGAIDTVIFPLRVSKIFTDPAGKFGSGYSDFVILEYDKFLSYVAQYLDPQITTSVQRDFIGSDLNLYHYADVIYVNLPPPRTDNYIASDYYVIQSRILQFGSSVIYYSGIDQVSSSFPILSFMTVTQFFSMFLGLILTIVVTVLMLLSIILISSLLLTNVETQTFEMGVLRMIGVTRRGIVQIVLLQALVYAIPAWVIGMVVGELGFIIISLVLKFLLQVSVGYFVSWEGMLLATGLGLVIPLISSILPIRSALGQSLSESLDTSRSKTKAVKVTINRSDDRKLPLSPVIVSSLVTVFGFAVYYVFPLSLLTFNLTLLLYMFFGLLISMLLGLVVLSLNLETIVERILAWIFLIWENSGVRELMLKNLVAHRLRNRKTTVMFALSVAFIIYIQVSFDIQIASYTYTQERNYGGAIINLQSYDYYNGLSNPTWKKQIEEFLQSEPFVRGYAYKSYSIESYISSANRGRISNLGRYKFAGQNFKGISPNFFDVADSKYLVVTEQDDDSKWTISERLYSQEGSTRVAIGASYKDVFGLDSLEDNLLVEMSFRTDSGRDRYARRIMKPESFLSAAPALKFSATGSSVDGNTVVQDALLSFPTYVRLSNGSFESVDDVPLQTMLVQTVSNDDEQLDLLATKLKRLLAQASIEVRDLRVQLETLQVASEVMNFFLIFAMGVAMFLCFFSLVSAMTSNIREQTKECGVLRAVGVKRFTMIRIFVEEAFVLVTTASLFGVLIGSLVAYTMVLQQMLFTELPLPFVFPWQIVLFVLGASAVLAFFSSFVPAYSLTIQPIVSLLRRVLS